MKFLTRLLFVLATVAVLLVIALFDSSLQTQVARHWLRGQPGVRGSVDSVAAGWTQLEAKDLRLQFDEALVAAPAITVDVPLLEILGRRPMGIHQIVAKGWIVDLNWRATSTGRGGTPTQAPTNPTTTEIAQTALASMHAVLASAGFPGDVSVDAVDLEGDVKLRAAPGIEPRWQHVVVRGGALAAGREGRFTLQVADFGAAPGPRDTLLVRFNADARVERIQIEHILDAARREPLQFTFVASVVRPANDEEYTLDVSRAGRRLLSIDTRRSVSTAEFAGTWRLEARNDDLALVLPATPALGMTLNGGGPFTADATLAHLQTHGTLAALADPPTTALSSLGRLSVASQFDLALDGTKLRLAKFSGSVTGIGPLGVIALQQPVDFDPGTRHFTVENPAADWLRVTLQGLPITVLPRLPAPWSLTAGDVTGEIVVRGQGDMATLRTTAPLTVTSATFGRDGHTWAENLDLSIGLQATWTATSWQIDAAPLAITSQGGPVASATARATKSPAAKGIITLTGKGEANMDALAMQPLGREIGSVPGRTLTTEFNAQLGESLELTGKISGIGRVAGRTLDATFSAHTDSQGRIVFLVPAKIAFGSKVTDFTAEGTWTGGATPHFGFSLTGTKADLDHLRPFLGLASWLVDASGPRSGGPVVSPRVSTGPAVAAWGAVPGWVKATFDKIRADGQDYEDVGGMVSFERGALRLESGHARLQPYPTAKLEGEVTFDPAAPSPYRLSATAALPSRDAAKLLPPSGTDRPVWEGKYTTTIKSTGAADGLVAAWRRRTDEFRLASDAGVLRLLRIQIADAIPRKDPKTNETLSRIGASVGDTFKSRHADEIEFVPNAVSRQAEMVLNLTYRLREIPYSALAVRAFRTADGTIHLNEITIEGSKERLIGTGEIAASGTASLTASPLRLDLKLSVGQEYAFALADSDLLSNETDIKGFTRFVEPIHLEGTLEHLDGAQFREILVKAAVRKP